MQDVDQRARAVTHIVVKREAEAAVKRVLEALGLPDTLKTRLAVERHLKTVLARRISQGEHDPVSRISF